MLRHSTRMKGNHASQAAAGVMAPAENTTAPAWRHMSLVTLRKLKTCQGPCNSVTNHPNLVQHTEAKVTTAAIA